MTVVSIDGQKVELVKEILDENNEDVIQKVMQYLKKIKSKKSTYPCQMTIEELKEEIEQSVLQYKKGESKTHEDFFKELRTW